MGGQAEEAISDEKTATDKNETAEDAGEPDAETQRTANTDVFENSAPVSGALSRTDTRLRGRALFI